MSGKGSRQRPLRVPREKFESNWDRIFGKKDQKKPLDNNTNNK